MNIPRQEYPRPQFRRENWINLNGEWDFEIDYAMSGEEKKFFERDSLNDKIIVPFCPESELSGINNKDFMPCVWYKRDIEIPSEYTDKEVILHFGAVDYRAILYVNGERVIEHKGGYTPFSANITPYLKDDKNKITLCAYDDTRNRNYPSGKQSLWLNSSGCFYTRTTGIWQTVWMEFVNRPHIDSIKITCDIDTPSVNVGVKIPEEALGKSVKIEALWDGKSVGGRTSTLYSKYTEVSFELSEKHLWEVGKGGLYDLNLTLLDGDTVCDTVESYFGLRSVALDGKAFKVNNETVFGRWVLDQGFYPDGIYTAPTDEALKADIEYSMQLGFNGARPHEKVFEPGYLYYADVMGYLIWGEYPNWGFDITEPGQIQYMLPEWIESMERDFNHPSIIGWCPYNETWDEMGRKQYDAILEMTYNITKAIDPSRPVIDTSGHYHVVTDIFDVHNYAQELKHFEDAYSRTSEGILNENENMMRRQKYDGKLPIFVSEYGGIKWSVEQTDGWGYGDAPKTEEEFLNRYKVLTEYLMANKDIMGFCYTQLYDVEQEQNGLMTYDRKFKFDPEFFKKVNSQKAAIEK